MLDFFLSGGPVMYPLLACSLIVTTVIIERCIFWIKTGMQRNRCLLDEVMKLCRQGDWAAGALSPLAKAASRVQVPVRFELH